MTKKYHLFSGYFLSEEDQGEIIKLIPTANIIWVGEEEEVKEIIRTKGEFRYTLECLREPEPSAIQQLKSKMFLRIEPVSEANLSANLRHVNSGASGIEKKTLKPKTDDDYVLKDDPSIPGIHRKIMD